MSLQESQAKILYIQLQFICSNTKQLQFTTKNIVMQHLGSYFHEEHVQQFVCNSLQHQLLRLIFILVITNTDKMLCDYSCRKK